MLIRLSSKLALFFHNRVLETGPAPPANLARTAQLVPFYTTIWYEGYFILSREAWDIRCGLFHSHCRRITRFYTWALYQRMSFMSNEKSKSENLFFVPMGTEYAIVGAGPCACPGGSIEATWRPSPPRQFSLEKATAGWATCCPSWFSDRIWILSWHKWLQFITLQQSQRNNKIASTKDRNRFFNF